MATRGVQTVSSCSASNLVLWPQKLSNALGHCELWTFGTKIWYSTYGIRLISIWSWLYTTKTSIHRVRVCIVKVIQSVPYAELSYYENTWYLFLDTLRCTIIYNRESNRSVVVQMETGIIPDRNGNPRIWNVNRNDDGDTWLNDNNGHDDNTWDPDNEFVFSNSFIISKNQHYDVGFLIALFTCPYHPPSILPISSSGTLTCAYALCEIDLFSHNIIINTFNVSSFRIDCLIHGAFSDLSRNVATDMDSIMSVKSKSIFCPTVYLWVLSSPTYRLYQILYTDFVLINIGKKLRGGVIYILWRSCSFIPIIIS